MASEFVQKHFDKILLVTLFLFMLFFTMTIAIVGLQWQKPVDPSTIAWCRETAGVFMGALIGLITGRRLEDGPKREKQDKPAENISLT